MNPLSWLLYLAEVAGNVSVLFIILAIGSLLASGLSLILFFSYRDDSRNSWRREDSRLECEKTANSWMKRWPKFIALSVLFFLLSGLIPSKQTIYLIAASEVGEEIVKDPRVQSVTNKSFAAIEAFLDEQIKKADQPVTPQEPADGT